MAATQELAAYANFTDTDAARGIIGGALTIMKAAEEAFGRITASAVSTEKKITSKQKESIQTARANFALMVKNADEAFQKLEIDDSIKEGELNGQEDDEDKEED